jgi:hypothetical protein
MFGRLKQFALLAIFLVTIVVCGAAYAASVDTTPVSIQVYDKSGDVLPFASVSVKGQTKQTGSKGEPVTFDLGKGKYSIQATHPLVKKANGAIAKGKAKLTLKKDKPSLAINLKMKSEMMVDATNPVLSAVQPNPKQRVSTTKPVPLSVNAEDPESNIATVKAVLDGKTDMGAPTVNGKTYSWVKTGVGEGDHQIIYTAWNFGGKTSTQTVDFTIIPAMGNLNGAVRYAGGVIAGATIKVDNGPLSTTTDAKGVYTIPAIRIGNHNVTITADGLHAQTLPITIEEDKTKTVNVTLVDDIAPAVPSNLKVTAGSPSSTSQTVSWDAVTDFNGVTYELQRYTGNTLTETKSLSGTSMSFTDLTAGTSYGYAVRALDKNKVPNASAWSAKLDVATQKLPTLSWVTPSTNQVLKGAVSLKNNYAIFGASNSVKQIDWVLLPSTTLGKTNPTTATGSSTLDWSTSSVANGNYSIKTTITDNEGNSSSSTIAFSINNPQTSKVTGKVTYNGKAVNGATVKSDENVSATTNSGGNYEIVINNLGNRTLTVKTNGLSDLSKNVDVPTTETVVADMAMTDGVAPSVPTDVAVVNTKPTASKQTVSWKASTDLSGIKEYTVSRFTGVTLAETKTVTGSSIIFNGLAGDTEYGYTVSATDKANTPNKSAATAVVRATTQKTPTISWMTPTADQSLTGSVTLQASYVVFSTGAKQVDWIDKTNNKTIGTTVIATLNDEPSQDWDTSAVSNGAKTLQTKITDDEDNTAIAEVAVTVDNILYGNLTGTVSDAEGAVVDVETVLKKTDGTVVGTVMTDTAGKYTFANVETGDYSLVFGAEGYSDKSVSKTVKVGDNTANATLSLLPRINGFTSTGRTLAIPDEQIEKAPNGLTVNPNKDEMLVVNANQYVNVYNPKTEQYIKTYNVPDLSINAFVAYDPLGFMAAWHGGSVWYNISNDQRSSAWQFAYHGLVSMIDGSIISADVNKIWKFSNHEQSPVEGYDIRPITGSNTAGGVAVSSKSVFVDGSGKKLYRLNLQDPTAATKAKSVQLGYTIGAIHHINGSRTLLVAEADTSRIHMYDTRTLVEYATLENVMSSNFETGRGNDLATYKSGTSYKLFISSYVDKKIYINTSN